MGPPVCLSNLKSLSVELPDIFSTIIRVPAFRRLSSFQISSDVDVDLNCRTLHATGDRTAFFHMPPKRSRTNLGELLDRQNRPYTTFTSMTVGGFGVTASRASLRVETQIERAEGRG